MLVYFFSNLVSTFTKGEQMIPVLNKIGTHCAVLGNHDFGKSHFTLTISTSKFLFVCLFAVVRSFSLFSINGLYLSIRSRS